MTEAEILLIIVVMLSAQTALFLSALIVISMKVAHIRIDLNGRLTELINTARIEAKAQGMIEGNLLGAASAEKHFALVQIRDGFPVIDEDKIKK